MHWHYFDEWRNQTPQLYRSNSAKRLICRLLQREVCIYGHFNRNRGFGVEDYYPEANQFFTFVRDPLTTMLSRYFSGKQLGDCRMRGGKPAPIAEKYPSLNDFVADRLERPYFINYLPGPLTLDNYREFFAANFIYVGVMEDLQTSVNGLARRLGMPPVAAPHANSSEHNETLSPELRRAFEQSRSLEYAIYNYALEHYRDDPSA